MRSGLERQVAELLDELKIDYEYENCKFPYIIEHTYTPDFRIGDIYLETKGYFDAPSRRKMLAVKKANPDLDIRLVFQAPHNKINKKSKTTYAKWATKNGFPWCAYHAIPREWLGLRKAHTV